MVITQSTLLILDAIYSQPTTSPTLLPAANISSILTKQKVLPRPSRLVQVCMLTVSDAAAFEKTIKDFGKQYGHSP
jgi:hypothetical protein